MTARSGNRQRKLSVWVSDDELQLVNEQARGMGMTAAALVRSWIGTDLGRLSESVLVNRELCVVMEQVLLELHREGNNLNQIARSVNSGNDPASKHVQTQLSEIRQSLGEIESQIRALWEKVM